MICWKRRTKAAKKATEKLELDNDYFSIHRKLFIYTSLFVFVCRLIFICTVKSGMRHFAPRTGSQMPLLQNFRSSWSFWNKFKVLLHKKWQSEIFLKDYSFCIYIFVKDFKCLWNFCDMLETSFKNFVNIKSSPSRKNLILNRQFQTTGGKFFSMQAFLMGGPNSSDHWLDFF